MINHIFRLSFLLALLGMGAARKGSGGKRCNTASISLVLVFISACEVVLWSVPLAGAYPDSALERTCLQDYFQQQKDNFKEVLASTHSLHGADACRWDGEGGSSHGATSMNALCSSSHSAMLADVMRGESELMDREGNRLRLEQITLANRNPLLEKHYRPLAATKKVLQMAPAELVYHGGCPSGELGKEQRSTSVADLQRLPLASLASLRSLPLMAPPTLLKGDGQSSLLGATPSFLLSTVGILLLACAALLRSKSSTTFVFKPKSSTSTSFGTLFTIFMATSCIFCVAPPSAEAALTLNDFILMKECGLRCWLGGLNFTIPDQTLEKAGITLHITGMSCAKIELGALGSQFTPPATLRLDGSGIGISCVAKWSAKVIGIDNTGTVSVTIGDSKVGGSISFTKDSDGLAGSASLSGCTTNLNIKDIHFSGGLAAKLLELFHDLIARVVSSQLNQVICTEIGSLVSTNLTAVLQSLDAQIRPYLKPVPPSPPPPVPADSLVLTGDSVIELIDYIANDVIGANGAFGLNKLVNAYTNNTGYINITDIPAPLSSITIPLVFGTNITVGLTNVAVAGLNSWSQFEALVPTDKYSLFSHSLLEHLNMTFVFFVNVTTAADGKGPIHGDYTLFESGILVLDMEHNELNGTAQLALSEKALKGLFPQQILNNLEECVLASLYDVNVTQLQFGMSIHQLKLIAGGGDIEKDLDAAIDNALLLFTTAFGPAIPAFFSGVVALAGRNEANRLAAELLAANHTCPPPPVVPPPPQVPAGSLVLADDPVIALVDYILNKVIGLNGPFGLNSLVDVLSQGTGVFDINNLPAPLSGMTFPIPGLGSSNVTVGLTDISVGGLDTWTKLEAVVPYGNYSLASQLLLENLTIELGFFLNVSLQFNNSVKASSLDETGRLVLSLNHTQLDNSIQLGLSESFLKSLQPQQLLDHPEDCIMASVSNVNITSLHLGTSAINMQVKRNNKNNNQLGQLVDALPYFNTTFNSMYSSFVMETLSWLGRQQLNQVVAGFMADNFTCPSPLPPPPPPPVPSGSLPLPNNTVVNLLDTVVNEMIGANGPLGLNKVIDAITSGSGGLDIGKLLSGHLPQITIPLPGVAFTDLTVGLTGASVGGLDTWSQLEALVPTSNYTLSTNVSLDHLSLSVDFFVNVSTAKHPLASSTLSEQGSIVLALDHNQLNNTLQLALNAAHLAHLTPQQLLAHPEDCIFAAVKGVNVTLLQLATSITKLQLGPIAHKVLMAQALDAPLQQMLPFFNTSFGPGLSAFLASTAAYVGRNEINSWLAAEVLAEEHVCPPPQLIVLPPPPPSDSLVLPGSSVVGLVDYVLDTLVGVNGSFGINKLVNSLTNNTGNLTAINIPPPLSGVTFPLPVLGGSMTIGLTELSLKGLNSWSKMNALLPVGSYSLGSQLALDHLALDASFFFKASFDDEGEAAGLVGAKNGTLSETGRLVIVLDGNQLNNTFELALNKSIVDTLQVSQLMLNPADCLAATVNDFNFTSFRMDTFISALQISLQDNKQLEAALQQALSVLNFTIGPTLSSFLAETAALAARTQVNQLAAAALSHDYTCPADDEPDYFNDWGFNMQSTVISFTVAAVILLVLSAVLAVMEVMIRRWKRKQVMESLNVNSNYEAHSLHNAIENRESSADPKMNPFVRMWSTCLALDLHVPIWARYLVPVVLVLTLALFISSNTSAGASVFAVVHLGDHSLDLPPLFEFSLGSSVTDMWAAGVYPLSLLIAVFSGAWPYLKLLIILVCWLLPLRLLATRRREMLLMVVDALGKWSLIDAYVLTLMMVAFYIDVDLPIPHPPDGSSSSSSSSAPEWDTSTATIVVKPDWGFYAFLLATIISLVITHVVLAFHRRAANWERRKQLFALEKKQRSEAVGSHAFRLGNVLLRCTIAGKVLVTALLLISLVMITVGSFIPSFEFQFHGLAAIALELLGYSTEQSFSVISLGTAIPSHSADPNGFGIRIIQATYFIFVFVVPLLHLITLLTLWLLPLRPAYQRRMFLVSEVLNAWSALEVFVISIIAALLEIEQFAEFIVGDKCELIDAITKQYFRGFLHGEPATCFSVVATLRWGCWLLFAACLLYLVAGFLVMRLCHKIMEEREDKAYRASLHSKRAYNHEGYSSSSSSSSPSAWSLSSQADGLGGTGAEDEAAAEQTLEHTKAILDEMKDSRCGPAIRYVCLMLRLVREEDDTSFARSSLHDRPLHNDDEDDYLDDEAADSLIGEKAPLLQ
ncbi:LBP/BPI/CETP family, carboxy-terminal domain protein [Balamuthia mandrillaris]